MNWDLLLEILGIALAILIPVGGTVWASYNHHRYSWKRIQRAVSDMHRKITKLGVNPMSSWRLRQAD